MQKHLTTRLPEHLSNDHVYASPSPTLPLAFMFRKNAFRNRIPTKIIPVSLDNAFLRWYLCIVHHRVAQSSTES